jgi:hypothetical protein
MVERQGREVIEWIPAYGPGIVGSDWLKSLRVDLCQINHGYRPAAWISPRFSTGIELLQLVQDEARLFSQFSLSCLVKTLILLDETSWHCPTSGEWLIPSLNQENPGTSFQSRHHNINCQGRTGVFVSELFGSCRGHGTSPQDKNLCPTFQTSLEELTPCGRLRQPGEIGNARYNARDAIQEDYDVRAAPALDNVSEWSTVLGHIVSPQLDLRRGALCSSIESLSGRLSTPPIP